MDIAQGSDFYPLLQRIVSKRSALSQKLYFVLLLLNLFLLVVAAVITKYEISFLRFRYAQTFLLGLGFLILIYMGVKKPERSWYLSRSLSETIKTLSWRYCFCSVPFGAGKKIDDPLFGARIEESCVESGVVNEAVTKYSSGFAPTREMCRVRDLQLTEKISLYLLERVDVQLKWYERKAAVNRVFSRVFFVVSFVISALGVLFSFLNEMNANSLLPTELFITISSSLMAWMQAKRFVELTAAYRLTAYEIEMAKSAAQLVVESEDLERFVDEMENLFSREHTQWIAKRQ